MTEQKNPKSAEVFEALASDDPELREAYADIEPAFMVAREVLRTRSELGISQAELARRMGTSQSVVSRLENMDGSPNLKTVLALAEALGQRVELRFVPTGTADSKAEPAAAAIRTNGVGLEVLGLFTLGAIASIESRTPPVTPAGDVVITDITMPGSKDEEPTAAVVELMKALKESVEAATRVDPKFALMRRALAGEDLSSEEIEELQEAIV